MRQLVLISGIGASPSSPSPYVRARARGKDRVRAAFPHAVIVRPSVLFGPGDAFLTNLTRLASLPVIPLFGRGDTRLQPVLVDDVAEAVTKRLESTDSESLLFELGGPRVYRYRELVEQVAIVTGGAKGIGRGIARVLVQAGARVVITDIDEAEGRQAAGELGVEFEALDVSSRDSCRHAVQAIQERLGPVGVLCSNAGIFPQAPLDTMTEDDWDTMIAVNLRGAFFMTQAVLPGMREQGYGRIVLTSSITGPVTGYPGWAHYGASKAGQLGFMRSAALECARDGITINAVMPGNVLTEGLKAQGEDYLREMAESIPTRALCEPQDIAFAVCFLASPEARYITGQTLIVDGGQILPESFEALK
ncbi:3-oxoacyl-ACP reductase FabG [Thioalkalivibrio paradoxus]|uniref:3-oxoacyl-ACP reductase FabG n=1 Tax=Thioalkalivibrio paradoxus TaxID=108010 RepID=UPI0002FFF4B3|nr:3-oxoacyl-ACP reductase FabG [Thioalkalivibrio paradoxus]